MTGKPCKLCEKPMRMVRVSCNHSRPLSPGSAFRVACMVLHMEAVCDFCDNDALRTLAKAMIE